MVKLYGADNCMQCKMTERKLKELNVPYEKFNIRNDEAALNHIKELGYQGVPVIEKGDLHFQGFRPTELQALVS